MNAALADSSSQPLAGIAAQFDRMDADTRHRAIYAQTLRDVYDEVDEALTRHRIPWDDFALLGLDGWMRFLDTMPSRRVNMHLRRQWARNAALPAKETDLNDWEYVGTAVAYCDVVTERQLADLVNRPSLVKKAVVIAHIRDLPAA